MLNIDPNINKIFFDKFKCEKKIGKGSFGTVYSGTNLLTQKPIAIKLEKKTTFLNTIETEAYRLIYLRGEGIPRIKCYGSNHSHNILIQELLGRNLEEIFISLKRKFSLKTVFVLGIEMLKRIQHVHSKHHIHRDIKPDNFMTGQNENDNTIYIIDFGLSKKFYSSSKQKHISFCKGKSLIGTARYCSRNVHKGYEQSRRDDIESIGYVLVYFLVGSLPWQGIKVKQCEDQLDKIAKKKYNTTVIELCRGCPEEFVLFFKHVDTLGFEEEPNYEYLIELFLQGIKKYCGECCYDYDWKRDVGKCCYIGSGGVRDCHCCIMINNNNNNKSKGVSLVVNKNGLSTTDESRNVPEERNEDKESRGEEVNVKYKQCNYESGFVNGNDNKDDNNYFDNEEVEDILQICPLSGNVFEKSLGGEIRKEKEEIQQQYVHKKNKSFNRNSCLFAKGGGNKKGKGYGKGNYYFKYENDKSEQHKREYDVSNNNNKEIENNCINEQSSINNEDEITTINNACNLSTNHKESKYLSTEKPPLPLTNFNHMQLQLNPSTSRNRHNNNVTKSTTDPLKDSTKCTCVII